MHSFYNQFSDLFKLWIDSIHCYSRLDDNKHKSDDKMRSSDDLDPPVVCVGTWKDEVDFKMYLNVWIIFLRIQKHTFWLCFFSGFM